MGPSVYKGPRYAVEALCDTIPAGKRRSEVRIIDVAAGTGLVGVEVRLLETHSALDIPIIIAM